MLKQYFISNLKQNQLKNGEIFMRKKLLFLRKISLILALSAFIFGSCTDIGVYKDTEFTSDVKNTTLTSPDEDEIQFSPSPDGSTVRITWPVVHGAGGYEFSLYINDDPNNPEVVGEENQVVDGCAAERQLRDDTKYKVVVKALGSELHNNKDAQSASQREFTTLIPTYATIPNGSNISDWFSSNPIPDGMEDTELAYVLEAGGSYTMSDIVDFGSQTVTFRGDKVNRATVSMTDDARISTTAGLKIKFIDFDCSTVAGSSSDAAFLLMSSNPDESIKGTGDYYLIEDPVVIQACDITGLQRHFMYDNNKKYCVQTLLVDDCIVKLETTERQPVIRCASGFVNDLTVRNSTFWHTGSTHNNYFVQYNNSGRPDRAGLVTASISYLNNTFYHVCYDRQWGNYNGFAGRPYVYWNMKDNIFVDSGNKQIVRRFLGGRRNQPTATFNLNTYWYDGAYASDESDWDTGRIIETDPMLKDPQNGDFTVQGSEQLAERTGDPRWLPEITENE